MDCVRLTPPDCVFPMVPCGRCRHLESQWDRISGKPYCPSCLESLAIGEAEAVIERPESQRCAVCFHQGTVRFLTFPLNAQRPIEIDLCAEHIRGLIGRCLGPHGFEQLRRQLYALGIEVGDIFLLHEEFYDVNGRALRPATETS